MISRRRVGRFRCIDLPGVKEPIIDRLLPKNLIHTHSFKDIKRVEEALGFNFIQVNLRSIKKIVIMDMIIVIVRVKHIFHSVLL